MIEIILLFGVDVQTNLKLAVLSLEATQKTTTATPNITVSEVELLNRVQIRYINIVLIHQMISVSSFLFFNMRPRWTPAIVYASGKHSFELGFSKIFAGLSMKP